MMSSLNSSRVKASSLLVPGSELVPSETNDPPSQNSSERGDGDRNEPETTNKPKLLVCKHSTIFSTFNARTLSLTSRKQELLSCFSNFKIDVLSIQEHRFLHQDVDFQHTILGKNKLITSSAWKNSQGTTIGGIGLLLSPKAAENLLSLKKISNRIIIAEFNSNPKTTFITCYSPTNVSDEAEVNAFYSSLSRATLDIPAHNFLVVAGDFNAQLGLDNVQFSYHKLTNRNGNKLSDFMLQHELLATNTMFMKNPKRLWSFQQPSGAKSQIDFILVRKKWKNSVRNSQSYSSFSPIGSDHRVISAHVFLSLRSSKKPKPNPIKNIDWQQVFSNSDLRSAYAIEVKNRYNLLSLPEDDIEKKYQNLIEANKHVCLSILPKKSKVKKKQLYQNDLITIARKNHFEAKAKHQAGVLYNQDPDRTLDLEKTRTPDLYENTDPLVNFRKHGPPS